MPMQDCYIVDAANAPWKRGSTEGVTFACQVLLSGEDGGPEALRFRFDDCPSVYAHMHLTAQFQLLLNGTMDFPRGNRAPAKFTLHGRCARARYSCDCISISLLAVRWNSKPSLDPV